MIVPQQYHLLLVQLPAPFEFDSRHYPASTSGDDFSPPSTVARRPSSPAGMHAAAAAAAEGGASRHGHGPSPVARRSRGPTNTLRRLSVRLSSRLTRAKPQYFAAKWREERSRTSHYITSHFNTTSPSPTHETTSIMTAMAMVVTIIVRLLASHV